MRDIDPRQAALEACNTYTTAELTTVNSAGFPVTSPVLTAFDADSGKIIFSTSIAYSAKVRNIRKNPVVIVHYYNREAIRPELATNSTRKQLLFQKRLLRAEATDRLRSDTFFPPRYVIRAKASIPNLGLEEATAYIARQLGSLKIQPSLRHRLRRKWWANLYRYYLLRLVVEVEPVEVLDTVVISGKLSDPRMLRRSTKRLGLIEQRILRHAPASSVALVDPEQGPVVAEARIQAVAPSLVCAQILHREISIERPVSSSRHRAIVKACVSAFGQSPDLEHLYHCSALGIAEITGEQIRVHPVASFHTIRPPGVIGDLWIGVHSTLKGRRNGLITQMALSNRHRAEEPSN
ncbi:MAG: hypothetical protein C4318_08755 [Acidimicrobiia bacterium]